MDENKSNEIVAFSDVLSFTRHTIPVPYEPRTTDNSNYVRYGFDNRYPDVLIDYYTRCATHATIINTKYSYIVGDGLRRKDGQELNLQLNANDKLPGFLQKIILDYLIHNYFTVTVQYAKLDPTRALSYDVLPARGSRWNKDKTNFWYSENWMYGFEEQFPRWKRNNTDSCTKMFFYDGYRPSLNVVYPDPDYIQCIEDIVNDLQIRRFNRTNIESNFSPQKKIKINIGLNTPQNLQDKHINNIKKFFTGADKERILYEFCNPGTNGQPSQGIYEIENIDSNNDWIDKYNNIQESTIKNIYEGHSINAALIGKETPGSLGNTQQLQISYDMFKDNYIQTKRNELEEALSDLFGFEVEFIDKPLIKPSVAPATLEKILTINELRKLSGYDTREDGDVYVPQPVAGQQPVQTSKDSNDINSTPVNDNIKNLTAKQHQQLRRIIREYSKEQLNRDQATVLLRSSLGLSDDDINSLLGISEDDNTIDDSFGKKEYKLTAADFDKVKHMGVSKSKYKFIEEGGEEKMRQIELKFDKESDIADYVLKNDIKNLTTNELKILIRKDLSIDLTSKELTSTLKGLTDAGIINVENTDGKIKITPPVKPDLKESREVQVMYEYEVKAGFGERLIPTSRDFCVKLIENDRYYTRKEIQQMSQIFGYDIFKYTGGFYHNPETNVTTPSCRHFWKSVVVSAATPDDIA